jgi:hypothetical protein
VDAEVSTGTSDHSVSSASYEMLANCLGLYIDQAMIIYINRLYLEKSANASEKLLIH